MEFGAILQNLKKGIYHPIYLLQGEEPYYIDEISDYIEKNVLTDAEKGFNQTVFYGKDSDALTIAESSLRFPMMANKQVIIVKDYGDFKRKTVTYLNRFSANNKLTKEQDKHLFFLKWYIQYHPNLQLDETKQWSLQRV